MLVQSTSRWLSSSSSFPKSAVVFFINRFLYFSLSLSFSSTHIFSIVFVLRWWWLFRGELWLCKTTLREFHAFGSWGDNLRVFKNSKLFRNINENLLLFLSSVHNILKKWVHLVPCNSRGSCTEIFISWWTFLLCFETRSPINTTWSITNGICCSSNASAS